VREVKFQ